MIRNLVSKLGCCCSSAERLLMSPETGTGIRSGVSDAAQGQPNALLERTNRLDGNRCTSLTAELAVSFIVVYCITNNSWRQSYTATPLPSDSKRCFISRSLSSISLASRLLPLSSSSCNGLCRFQIKELDTVYPPPAAPSHLRPHPHTVLGVHRDALSTGSARIISTRDARTTRLSVPIVTGPSISFINSCRRLYRVAARSLAVTESSSSVGFPWDQAGLHPLRATRAPANGSSSIAVGGLTYGGSMPCGGGMDCAWCAAWCMPGIEVCVLGWSASAISL